MLSSVIILFVWTYINNRLFWNYSCYCWDKIDQSIDWSVNWSVFGWSNDQLWYTVIMRVMLIKIISAADAKWCIATYKGATRTARSCNYHQLNAPLTTVNACWGGSSGCIVASSILGLFSYRNLRSIPIFFHLGTQILKCWTWRWSWRLRSNLWQQLRFMIYCCTSVSYISQVMR